MGSQKILQLTLEGAHLPGDLEGEVQGGGKGLDQSTVSLSLPHLSFEGFMYCWAPAAWVPLGNQSLKPSL